jgi:hypothetical protein
VEWLETTLISRSGAMHSVGDTNLKKGLLTAYGVRSNGVAR